MGTFSLRYNTLRNPRLPPLPCSPLSPNPVEISPRTDNTSERNFVYLLMQRDEHLSLTMQYRKGRGNEITISSGKKW